jgi:hypothetical protein
MIRMDEVQDILQMPLTENINELISIGSDEWKQELIKDNLSRFI